MVTKGILGLLYVVIINRAVVFETVLLYQKVLFLDSTFFGLIGFGACFFGVFVILLLRVLF
jgi:hypothetical protein